MKEQLKSILWLTPLIGVIYLFVCSINQDLWIDTEKTKATLFGLIIQILSIVFIPVLILNLLK